MNLVRLVGGPADGRTIEVREGLHVIRVPEAVVFMTAEANEPTFTTHDYRVYGDEARWERMVDDAWGAMDVTVQLFRDRDSKLIRAEIRRQLTRMFEDLAPGRELDRRKMWRVTYDPKSMLLTFKAFVGPHRVARSRLAEDVGRWS